jgi:Tfp pilus assembly protein PilO
VVEPLWQRIQAVQTRARANREKIKALTRLLEQAGTVASDYQREVAEYVEPASQGEAAGEALLQELEALSRSSGVQVDLKPRPGKAEAQFTRLEVEVNLEGSQQEVLTFLDGVFRMPRLLTIERLKLSANPVKGDLLRAHLLLHDFTL